MKKSTVNNKVLRVIAIAMSAMIATTSVPVAALAADEEIKEVTAVTSVIEEINKIDNEKPGVSQEVANTIEAVDAAQKATNAVTGNANSTDPTKELKDDLKTVGDEVKATENDLETAKEKMKAANTADKEALSYKEAIEDIAAYTEIPVVDENGQPVYETDENGNVKTDENGNFIQKKEVQLVVFAAKEQAATSSADEAIDQANTANTTNNENAANTAKSNAQKALSDAQTGLTEASAELETASKKATKAENAYTDAYNKSQEAQALADEAQANLVKALEESKDENGDPVYTGDVEDALKAVLDAQVKAGQLSKDAEDALNDFMKASEYEILKQYAIVQKIIDVAPNNPDGTKNLENAEYDGVRYWSATRKLCNLILKNHIYKEYNATLGDTAFSIQYITGYTRGEEYTNENGELWVDYNPGYGNKEKEEVIPDDSGWIRSNDNQDNRIKVKYTVDGKEVCRYFNYKTNSDGSIYIYERTYSIENDKEEVKAQEYVKATDDTWKTKEGKAFTNTDTTHTVLINSNDQSKGFYAIDTENSKVVKTTSATSTAPTWSGKTLTFYREQAGENSQVKYTYDKSTKAIVETVTKKYDKYSLTVSDKKWYKDNGQTGACDTLDAALTKMKNEVENKGHVLINYTVEELNNGKVKINYSYVHKNGLKNGAIPNKIKTSERTSKTYYQADVYDTFTKGTPAVAGNDSYWTQKLVWETDEAAISAANDLNNTERQIYQSSEIIKLYQDKLNNLTEAKEKYATAKADVDALVDRIKELKKRVDDLENIKVGSTSALSILRTELDKEQKALADAQKKKADLEKKVEDARKAVESIDLSRFTNSTGDDDSSDDNSGDDDTSSSDSTTATVANNNIAAGNQTVQVNTNTTNTRRNTNATTNNTAANNGQEADQTSTQIAENDVAKTDVPNIEEETKSTEVTKIAENKTPLMASVVEDGANLSWLWILLVVLIVATFVAAYENHKRKMKAQNAKINN